MAMPEQPESFTLTVVRKRLDDLPLTYFVATLFSQQPNAEWEEVFGSEDHLNNYLRGLTTAFRMMGWMGGFFDWTIPAQWSEPSGLRWHISPDGAEFRCERLNSDGEVVDL